MNELKTLLTPRRVVELAFAECEYMDSSAISAADIAAAEERYIVPVTGRALYEAMLGGDYGEVRDEFAAPAAAAYVRLAMQPLFDIRTGRFGAVAPRTSYSEPAERAQILDMRRALRERARTLLQRLSSRLMASADDIPEYRPENDILNRCTTYGGLVQIR